MTPLGQELARRIALTGPITVADYMAECLTHPRLGYYVTRDPLGPAGDFTTAPEISQMFGELLGLCLAQTWIEQGRPGRIVLAEAGPGRGTLVADALRATRAVPGFHAALSLHLVEASPVLRHAQAARLSDHAPTWHAAVDDLPEGPLFLFANEFLDALPIRQFVRDGALWRERMVGWADGAFRFGLAPPSDPDVLHHRLADTRPGDLVEVCTPATSIVSELARRIARWGGAALFVDYGGGPSLGDTLQAVASHRMTSPLEAPGEADLTAHVDFVALARAAKAAGAAASGITPQGLFLERLGIAHRAQALAAALQGPKLDQHLAAYRRLTDAEEMGHLFRAMSVYPRSLSPPPGLDP